MALTLLNTLVKSWYSSGTLVRSIGFSAEAEAECAEVLPFDKVILKDWDPGHCIDQSDINF